MLMQHWGELEGKKRLELKKYAGTVEPDIKSKQNPKPGVILLSVYQLILVKPAVRCPTADQYRTTERIIIYSLVILLEQVSKSAWVS